MTATGEGVMLSTHRATVWTLLQLQASWQDSNSKEGSSLGAGAVQHHDHGCIG